MLEASVIIIGDEILSGAVTDANGHLAAARLRAHGIPLTGVHVVPDDEIAIAGALRTELARGRPRLILTTGGIGATHDDVTFAAIADATGRELELAEDSVARLDEALTDLRHRGFAVEREERDQALSMAVVPAGATVLEHSGWVCGAMLPVDGGIDATDGATIVALPGVPNYFRDALDDVVVPELLEGRGRDETVVELPHRVPELVLTSRLRDLSVRWPDVRIGSYPGDPMLVRLRGPAAAVAAARDDVTELLRELEVEGGEP